MRKIAKDLAEEAKRKGICEDWHKELSRMNNKDSMVQMYIRGLDFCISNNYPSHDYMRSNFKGVMEKYGVFLDDRIDEVNPKIVVCHGATSGNIIYYGYTAGEIIVKDTSEITITASDDSFVMIDVFDDALVDVIASDNAKVCINRYAGGAVINTSKSDNAVIKENRKMSKTYVSRS